MRNNAQTRPQFARLDVGLLHFDDGEIVFKSEIDSDVGDSNRFQLIQPIQQKKITTVKEKSTVLALDDRVVLKVSGIAQRLSCCLAVSRRQEFSRGLVQ